jgi:hypothetical protein
MPTERLPLVGNVSANFEDRRVVSTMDPYGRNLGCLDQSRYFFFQVAPHTHEADPISDPLLLRKSGIVWNRTQTSGSVARNSDHRSGHFIIIIIIIMQS